MSENITRVILIAAILIVTGLLLWICPAMMVRS